MWRVNEYQTKYAALWPGAAPPTVHRESGARDEQSPVQRYESPGALSIYPNHDKHCACSSPHMMLCIACAFTGGTLTSHAHLDLRRPSHSTLQARHEAICGAFAENVTEAGVSDNG